MIDTIGLIAPLDREIYEKLKKSSILTSRIKQKDGEELAVLFQYAMFDQQFPSSNYNVIWKLNDERFCYDELKGIPIKRAGWYHLRLEFSCPKLLWGHNVDSVSVELALEAVTRVIGEFEKTFNVILPALSKWYCNRIDICANYVMQDAAAVADAIFWHSKLEYPRREKKKQSFDGVQVSRFGMSGLLFSSRVNTLKIYAKGPEFRAHDKSRLRDVPGVHVLQSRADKVMRAEVELRGRLQYLFQGMRQAQIDRHDRLYKEAVERERDYDNSADLLMQYDWLDSELQNKIESDNIETSLFSVREVLRLERDPTWNGFPKLLTLLESVDLRGEYMRMISILQNGQVSRCMNAEEVLNIFKSVLGESQAKGYWACWNMLAVHGKVITKQHYKAGYISRVRRACRELNIGLKSRDLVKIANDGGCRLPSDFSWDMNENNPYYQLPLLKVA